MKLFLRFFLAWSVPLCLNAQDSTSSLSLTAAVEMNSIAVINPAMADSVGSSLSLNPFLKLELRSGLGFIAKACFLTGSPKPGYYMSVFSPFYSVGNEKIALDISYSHLFIKQNTAVPYTPILNEVYAAFTYKTGFLSPHIGVDYGFGTDTSNLSSSAANDINLFAGFNHPFDWDMTDEISVNFIPTLTVNMGTNRYFNFLRSTKFIAHNKNYKNQVKGKGNGSNSSGSVSSPGFELSNLEANFDLNFSYRKFSVEPSGSLFLPLSGTDKNIFGYWQMIFSYKF